MITKSASPSDEIKPGGAITYTLRIRNEGSITATGLMISDTLPTNAHYVSGGTRQGDVVTWDLPELGIRALHDVSFVITASDIITNVDYEVRSDGGFHAVGQAPIQTKIQTEVDNGDPDEENDGEENEGTDYVYLPLLMQP